MLGKLARSRSLRTLRLDRDKNKEKYVQKNVALNHDSKQIIANSSRPMVEATMVPTVTMTASATATATTAATSRAHAPSTAHRHNQTRAGPPKPAQLETETIPHGPSKPVLAPAVSVPRAYVSVSQGRTEHAPRLVNTRPRARTDTHAVIRPKWEDPVVLEETRSGTTALTRNGTSAKLMSETEKHEEPDQLEGTPEARLRSKFASFQNRVVPTRSRSMREPPSYTKNAQNRRAALDVAPSFQPSSFSPPPHSHSNTFSPSLASSSSRAITSTTITAVSSRSRSSSVIYTKSSSASIFGPHHTVSSPSNTNTSVVSTSPETTPPSNPTPSRSMGLRRAASTKQYDADRNKRHDLVSPLRLSPPDLENPQSAPLVTTLKRSQSTLSVRRISTITTSIDAIARVPLSSINNPNLSVLSRPNRLDHQHRRPSTSSGDSSTSPLAFSTVHTPSTGINIGPVDESVSNSATELVRPSTASSMASIPTSSSVTSLVRPKHEFNKRVSRDDLYINTRTSKNNFRSYHVPIRGRAPSPRESPRSESPAVTLVRTQTPDSIVEASGAPIGMALGSPTFVVGGSSTAPPSAKIESQSTVMIQNHPEDKIHAPATYTHAIDTSHHDILPDKSKKWRFFGSRSRTKKGSERGQDSLPTKSSASPVSGHHVHQVHSDEARRLGVATEVRGSDKVHRMKPETRITPAEAAMFKPRMTSLKRHESTRSAHKMEISGPTSLQRVPVTVAMPGLDGNGIVVSDIPHVDWEATTKQESNASGFLSLNIPDSKLERYSIMFNGILQREGVSSSALQQELAVSCYPGLDDRALFLEKQATLLGRSHTILNKSKTGNTSDKDAQDKLRAVTPTRSSTFPMRERETNATTVIATNNMLEQSKSPAFSLFPTASSQQHKAAVPLAGVLQMSPGRDSTDSPSLKESMVHLSKETSKQLASQPRRSESPVDIGIMMTKPRETTSLSNSQSAKNSKVSPSRISSTKTTQPSEVVPFALVGSDPTPKNVPHLRHRNGLTTETTVGGKPVTASTLIHALSAAGMTGDAHIKAVSRIDLERQASTASDKNPIVMDNTNGFPQPPAARSVNKKSTLAAQSSNTTHMSARQVQVQPHRIRSPSQSRAESPKPILKAQAYKPHTQAQVQPFPEAKFDEEPLPGMPLTTAAPSVPRQYARLNPATVMSSSRDHSHLQRSPLGPNTSVLVMDSDEETEASHVPRGIPYGSSMSVTSGASSSATSLSTRQRSESNTTTSSKLTTSTQDEAEIALRNAVEVSIARQISVSRKHRQMLQKSGLIQLSPTVNSSRV
ncbi:uncharacterized protein BROUX77_001218 [Berkeleyomyces rouxiae]|uniref:uncharacterized protein n=1 Tax=Berkeleyomyces rouxiae TaxID=2035830 RepID=UPI003B7E8DE7